MNDLLDDTALDLLLAPLSAAQPCGPDINGGMTYAGIREARRVDDPNQGVWEKQVPKRADWGQVERLCLRSRVLRLAGRVTEWEIGEQKARHRGVLDDVLGGAHHHGSNAVGFEVARHQG